MDMSAPELNIQPFPVTTVLKMILLSLLEKVSLQQ